MRDRSRLYPYSNRLAAAWSKVPDWRLSQLMCNFFRYLGRDPFYMEDEEFMSELENFIKEVTAGVN